MIDLDTVKSHLRVDGDEEDALIQAYTDAAFSTFEQWTNRKLIAEGEPLPEPAGNSIVITKAICQGALLLIGHWFMGREAVVTGTIATEMPMATQALWGPHRWVNL
ncbi:MULTISPECIES: head-tail connector protein [unclassified Pseudomonas]|uniref:head-tail connector protein n=1 Tax=unclassified Pseudomonas TaxID=196821 RepID=UPI00076171AA|nr:MULTISPECIES: head-tail connector protein [unclassified Pseudomonas]KAF4558193.1 phage gp6-like head-tail connector protein [Pseudomonas sp. CES]